MTDNKFKKPNIEKMLIISIGITLIALLAVVTVNIKTDSGTYTLPSDSIVFTEEEFINPNNPDDKYAQITFNGREYISYGKLKLRKTEAVLGQCVGYIDRGYENDTQVRILVLSETEDLIVRYPLGNIGDQPIFFRARDTVKRDIEIPEYIQSLGYEFWD